MSSSWQRFKDYIRASSETKLNVGKMTVSRLSIFGVAAMILLIAVAALVFLVYGDQAAKLVYTETNVAVGYNYQLKDNVLSYRTAAALVKLRASASDKVVATSMSGSVEGFDASANVTILYAGSAVQVQGHNYFSLSGGDVMDVRAGSSYGAVLYETDADDRNILLVRAAANADGSTPTAGVVPLGASDVIAFDFFTVGGKELLWVSTVDVGQFTEESLVRIYDCTTGGTLLFYSDHFYNQTIYDAYVSEKCLFLVGTQDIIRYDREDDGGFSSERYRVRVFGTTIVDFAYGSGGAYFIEMPNVTAGGSSNLLRLLTVSEDDDTWSTIMQLYMPAQIVGAYLQNNVIYVFTTNRFNTYTYAGSKRLDIELRYLPTAVLEYQDSAFLLFTDTACYKTILN